MWAGSAGEPRDHLNAVEPPNTTGNLPSRVGAIGNQELKRRALKALSLTPKGRKERREEVIREHRNHHSIAVEWGMENIALWYAEAWESLHKLDAPISQEFVMEFTPQDQVDVAAQVEAIKQLGWPIKEIIGCPHTMKIYVICEDSRT